MKSFLYLILTFLVSAGALMAGLNMENPLPALIIAFGIWFFFIWAYFRRQKKESQRKLREQLFLHYMRSKLK